MDRLLTLKEIDSILQEYSKFILTVYDITKSIETHGMEVEVFKAQDAKSIKLRDEEWIKKLNGYHCPECDTPNFIHFVIPIKVWDGIGENLWKV